MTYRLDDKVKWQNGRTASYRHVGTVVCVVPAGAMPYEVAWGDVPDGVRLVYDTAVPRNHESYIVYDERTKRLYWPRVGRLRLAVAK